MKKILFPTDLSEAANKAFVYALHLADQLGASITTLHVYQKPEVRAAGLPHTLRKFYETYDLHEFNDYKDAIPALHEMQDANGFSNLNIVHTLKSGTKIVPTILEAAVEEKADLIVMGTTGARGLKEIFLGSVAGEILENANCPVLAVPELAEFDGQINTIGMTTSFKDEDQLALKKILEIFTGFNPQVYCVNVDLAHTSEYTDRMETFAQAFSDRSGIYFDVLEGTDFQNALTSYMEEKGIDLLAMVVHKRSFLEELFSYSRTKKMSYHSRIPIFSVQANIL